MEPVVRTLPSPSYCSPACCIGTVTKLLVVTGVALVIIASIAYGAKKISRDNAMVVVFAGVGTVTISALADVITAIVKCCLKNEDDYDSSLSLDSSSPLLRSPRQSYEEDTLIDEDSLVLPPLIELDDLEWKNIPLEKAQGIFEEYQKELSGQSLQDEHSIKTICSKFNNMGYDQRDFQKFVKEIYHLERNFDEGYPLPKTFLHEELRIASLLIASYLECHYKPDLMPILPAVYLHYSNNRRDFLDEEERENIIQGIVEGSCQIKLNPEVVAFFMKRFDFI